ncbi:shufflon system plasmid conjugative transfer pilus tip adhesin PilV [Methylotenera sp.]|uniref:shufflon system plasmid conjugative transfer pilus tip adhesin PilV n=1 Tax=Methylotenera sp. TaxID=2051956 RepID=UPI002EDAC791
MGNLIAVLVAGLLGMMALPTYLNYQTSTNENVISANVAQQQSQFNQASSSYIEQNSIAIQAAASSTTPAIITVAMLKAVNLLPAAFNATNVFGQTWTLQILEPSAGNLQALAMTSGGTAINDKQATKIANLVGAQGGFIPKNDSGIYAGSPATAYGSYAGWTLPTANYTGISGGQLASLLTFNNGQLIDNRLYRNAVPGQPQLNQMNTPLIMAATQTLNSACTTTGAISQDGNGAVLSCQAGTWQAQGSAYWKDPVNTAALLPTCNAAAAWQTRIVQTPTTGTGPRAYTCNGAAWRALAVDDTGNMTIAATMTVGKTQINDVVTENTACSSNGLVARDSVGLILSCQSGSWKKNGGVTRSSTYITAINGSCNNGSYAIGSQTQTVCNGYSTSCTTCTSPTTIDCLNFVPVCSTFCTSSSTGTTTTCANP